MKKNIDAMNHPTKVKESIGERIYTIVVYLLLILISATRILPPYRRSPRRSSGCS